MARSSYIICDGCGNQEPAVSNEDIPASFFHIKVTVGNWGDTFDLCQSCHSSLLDKANVKKWTRFKPSPTKPISEE